MNKTARSARGTAEMSKYMNQVADYPSLQNLVDYVSSDQSVFPDWEQQFVAETKLAVQRRLKEHFDASGKTRSVFASLPTEIWKEAETHLFNLTEQPRPILGYLPKAELQRINDMISQAVLERIRKCQTTLDDFMDATRASSEDKDEIGRLAKEGTYFFSDLEAYVEAVDNWTKIANKKIEILKELEEREKHLKSIDYFEINASNSSRLKKGTSLELAKETKFRAEALKKMLELDARATALINSFKEETGREFEVDGINYEKTMQAEIADRSPRPALTLLRISLEHHTEGYERTHVSEKDIKQHYLLYTGTGAPETTE